MKVIYLYKVHSLNYTLFKGFDLSLNELQAESEYGSYDLALNIPLV